jgi:hypothetical protein
MSEQQKPWPVDYFQRARPHMTSWVETNLLPHINSPGHSKICIKAPVKSGKREIAEYTAQRDLVSGDQQPRPHAFISSWHRTADADQRTELSQQNLEVFSTTNQKNVEICKNWIRGHLGQRKPVVLHVDECDYGTGPLQILSNLWNFICQIGDESVVKVILYSATPEEVIYASARHAENQQQREFLHEMLVTTQLVYTPPEGYCGSARFLQEGLVVNAMPFFEKKQGGGYAISQQGRQLIEEFNAALQVDPSKNCIVLRLSYCEGGHKIEHKAFHQFINHIDTFTELHGFSVICDKADGLKLKKSTNVTVRADRIEWSERSYWDDLAEGPRRKFLFVIDQTSSRSTEWVCHNRIHACHDFRHTVQYAAVSQAQERIVHYWQRYGNTFQRIKVYGHLPTFQLSAGVITHDQYFQNAWEQRKLSSRRQTTDSDNESVASSGSSNSESNEAMYLVRESVSKRRHPDCPETGLNLEESTRLLQDLGCWANTSISSRVAGKPKQVPDYNGYWYAASSETWSSVWEEHCRRHTIVGVTRSNVRNPFANAESHKHEDGRWRGQHRGWQVLRWIPSEPEGKGQLFDIDRQDQPRRIDDLGSTGGERNKVCYNERGELGVLIVRPTGEFVTKNKLVSVNSMYASN